MVTLSESAVDKLKEMLEERSGENALRLYIKPGGCTGFSYGMALDMKKDDDHAYEIGGVTVVIDDDSLELVDGSEVDYVDDLTGQGFRILNPNASSTCGCGSSFRTATQAGVPGSCD